MDRSRSYTPPREEDKCESKKKKASITTIINYFKSERKKSYKVSNSRYQDSDTDREDSGYDVKPLAYKKWKSSDLFTPKNHDSTRRFPISRSLSPLSNRRSLKPSRSPTPPNILQIKHGNYENMLDQIGQSICRHQPRITSARRTCQVHTPKQIDSGCFKCGQRKLPCSCQHSAQFNCATHSNPYRLSTPAQHTHLKQTTSKFKGFLQTSPTTNNMMQHASENVGVQYGAQSCTKKPDRMSRCTTPACSQRPYMGCFSRSLSPSCGGRHCGHMPSRSQSPLSRKPWGNVPFSRSQSPTNTGKQWSRNVSRCSSPHLTRPWTFHTSRCPSPICNDKRWGQFGGSRCPSPPSMRKEYGGSRCPSPPSLRRDYGGSRCPSPGARRGTWTYMSSRSTSPVANRRKWGHVPRTCHSPNCYRRYHMRTSRSPSPNPHRWHRHHSHSRSPSPTTARRQRLPSRSPSPDSDVDWTNRRHAKGKEWKYVVKNDRHQADSSSGSPSPVRNDTGRYRSSRTPSPVSRGRQWVHATSRSYSPVPKTKPWRYLAKQSTSPMRKEQKWAQTTSKRRSPSDTSSQWRPSSSRSHSPVNKTIPSSNSTSKNQPSRETDKAWGRISRSHSPRSSKKQWVKAGSKQHSPIAENFADSSSTLETSEVEWKTSLSKTSPQRSAAKQWCQASRSVSPVSREIEMITDRSSKQARQNKLNKKVKDNVSEVRSSALADGEWSGTPKESPKHIGLLASRSQSPINQSSSDLVNIRSQESSSSFLQMPPVTADKRTRGDSVDKSLNKNEKQIKKQSSRKSTTGVEKSVRDKSSYKPPARTENLVRDQATHDSPSVEKQAGDHSFQKSPALIQTDTKDDPDNKSPVPADKHKNDYISVKTPLPADDKHKSDYISVKTPLSADDKHKSDYMTGKVPVKIDVQLRSRSTSPILEPDFTWREMVRSANGYKEVQEKVEPHTPASSRVETPVAEDIHIAASDKAVPTPTAMARQSPSPPPPREKHLIDSPIRGRSPRPWATHPRDLPQHYQSPLVNHYRIGHSSRYAKHWQVQDHPKGLYSYHSALPPDQPRIEGRYSYQSSHPHPSDPPEQFRPDAIYAYRALIPQDQLRSDGLNPNQSVQPPVPPRTEWTQPYQTVLPLPLKASARIANGFTGLPLHLKTAATEDQQKSESTPVLEPTTKKRRRSVKSSTRSLLEKAPKETSSPPKTPANDAHGNKKTAEDWTAKSQPHEVAPSKKSTSSGWPPKSPAVTSGNPPKSPPTGGRPPKSPAIDGSRKLAVSTSKSPAYEETRSRRGGGGSPPKSPPYLDNGSKKSSATGQPSPQPYDSLTISGKNFPVSHNKSTMKSGLQGTFKKRNSDALSKLGKGKTAGKSGAPPKNINQSGQPDASPDSPSSMMMNTVMPYLLNLNNTAESALNAKDKEQMQYQLMMVASMLLADQFSTEGEGKTSPLPFPVKSGDNPNGEDLFFGTKWSDFDLEKELVRWNSGLGNESSGKSSTDFEDDWPSD